MEIWMNTKLLSVLNKERFKATKLVFKATEIPFFTKESTKILIILQKKYIYTSIIRILFILKVLSIPVS